MNKKEELLINEKRKYDNVTKALFKLEWNNSLDTFQYQYLLHVVRQLFGVKTQEDIKKELNIPKWKFIKKGERLPVRSYIKSEYMSYMPNEKDTIVGCDCWYLPVVEINNIEFE